MYWPKYRSKVSCIGPWLKKNTANIGSVTRPANMGSVTGPICNDLITNIIINYQKAIQEMFYSILPSLMSYSRTPSVFQDHNSCLVDDICHL